MTQTESARHGLGLMEFLAELDACHVSYRLDRARLETIMVTVVVPGERWEVEFFAGGEVEVERFRTVGAIEHGLNLRDLWPLTE